jgi:hypothetical protein
MSEFVQGVDRIMLLARGPSWYRCPDTKEPNTELWGCNTAYRDRSIDRLFVMHDIRWEMIYEDKDFVDNVNNAGFPVYTPGKYAVLKNSFEYPLQDIFDEFGVIPYFLNVIAYMIALAITKKPKQIELYGIDMRSGAEYTNERANVEFWLGVATGRGIKIETTPESMIFKSGLEIHYGRLFYGYIPRQEKDGLYGLIPEGNRKCAAHYRLEPIGEELS